MNVPRELVAGWYDDLPDGVFADWLEEHGYEKEAELLRKTSPGDPRRAEFCLKVWREYAQKMPESLRKALLAKPGYPDQGSYNGVLAKFYGTWPISGFSFDDLIRMGLHEFDSVATREDPVRRFVNIYVRRGDMRGQWTVTHREIVSNPDRAAANAISRIRHEFGL